MYPSSLVIIIISILFRYSTAQCVWDIENATKISTNSITCKLTSLEQISIELTNSQKESVTKLNITCDFNTQNDNLDTEDVINNNKTMEIQQYGVFNKLQSLSELILTNCKLHQIADGKIFENLHQLKRLAVHMTTTNTFQITKSSFANSLQELQTLDLSSSNIKAIPEGTICPLRSLQMLNLTRNRIKSAEKLGFYDITRNLEQNICHGGSEILILDASFNEINALSDQWPVSKLRRLQQLLLSDNNITDISPESLLGLISLRILDLSSNRLESLPNDLFAACRELREIHLQKNELFELPRGLFHRLEQLLVLDLSANQLSSHHIDDGTFIGLIRLIVLNLSSNALTRIDSKTFKDLFFLQILDLRNNSIGFVDENAFLPLYNLHTLNLAENRLHTLDNRIFNGLYVLSKLTLNNNLVTQIDVSAFKNCSDLKELDLSSNQLTEIPEAIQVLSMLRSLDLGENLISTFKNGSFRNLGQLTGLRLIDNQIGNLTKGMLWDLTSLQVLNLAKNKVQNVERGTFDRNPQLEAIRLDKNFLMDVDGVFSTLTNLLWLNLAENHLVWFDYAFIPSNLKWLDIHGNYIQVLGNYYKIQDKDKIKLKTLDASHNRLTSIASINIPDSVELLFINNNLINNVHVNTFSAKSDLVRVDLYANALESLHLHSLRVSAVNITNFERKKPIEFYLGGNPFICDCSMDWLITINNTTAFGSKIMDLSNIECRIATRFNKKETKNNSDLVKNTRISDKNHGNSDKITGDSEKHDKNTSDFDLITVPVTKMTRASFLCQYQTHCFALCHCCEFDACDCEMTCPVNCKCRHDQTWNTNIVDCGNTNTTIIPQKIPMDSTQLYLDGNKISKLEANAFIGRKNLRILFLNQSQVYKIENRTFNGLGGLKILHLEDNLLQDLKGYEFQDLIQLRELYLQRNKLQTISDGAFKDLINLEILRLDGNRLRILTITQSVQKLYLSENLWTCNCVQMRYFNDVHMKIQDFNQITCNEDLNNDISTRIFINNNTKLYKICQMNASFIPSHISQSSTILLQNINANSSTDNLVLIIIIITVIFVVILTILLLILIITRCVKFKIWLYTKYGVRLNWTSDTNDKLGKSKTQYDALVLYSNKDTELVNKYIVNYLEKEPNHMRLCLMYRDITSQELIQNELQEIATNSKRVILLLTRNFCQTEWQNHEKQLILDRVINISNTNKTLITITVSKSKDLDLDLINLGARSLKLSSEKNDLIKFHKHLRYLMPDKLIEIKTHNNYTVPCYDQKFRGPMSTNFHSDSYSTNTNNPNEHIYSCIDYEYPNPYMNNEPVEVGVHWANVDQHRPMRHHALNSKSDQHVQAYLV